MASKLKSAAYLGPGRQGLGGPVHGDDVDSAEPTDDAEAAAVAVDAGWQLQSNAIISEPSLVK